MTNAPLVTVDKGKIYERVRYLIDRGYVEESQFDATVERMIMKEKERINSNVGHEIAVSTDS